MGIINVTPDSFFDGGRHATTDAAVAHALQLAEEGADLLDIGGESTRPGATPVSLSVELERVIPVLSRLRDCGVPLSVDTRRPEVMQAAIDSGAAMINDVNALQAQGALQICSRGGVGVCLMHMQGDPQSMQINPQYRDVVSEVKAFLTERMVAAEQAGIGRDQIVLDPGFGFGKTLQHNLTLLRNLECLKMSGVPILAGLSRKSVLGAIVGKGDDDRMVASAVAALLAVQHGASVVRVHDVKATRNALAVLKAVEENHD